MEAQRFWGLCESHDHYIDTPEHFYVCLNGGSVSGNVRLAGTPTPPAVPGPGDRVCQPTLWDGDGEGSSTEILTQQEKDALLLRMWHGDD